MIRQDDSVFAPFQRFLSALLKKLLGKQDEVLVAPSGKDAEAIFGMPVEVLDTMDPASVGRVLSDPRFLETYATLVAAKGNYARTLTLLQLALKANHPEPTRIRELMTALAASHGLS